MPVLPPRAQVAVSNIYMHAEDDPMFPDTCMSCAVGVPHSICSPR